MWGEGNGTSLQYSCLENPMDGRAWWAVVHGIAKNRTPLSDFTFTFHLHALEKEMAAHSTVLAWRIPGMEEPGGLPSMGSYRVGHDWSNLAAAAVNVMTSSLDYKLHEGRDLICFWSPFTSRSVFLERINEWIKNEKKKKENCFPVLSCLSFLMIDSFSILTFSFLWNLMCPPFLL